MSGIKEGLLSCTTVLSAPGYTRSSFETLPGCSVLVNHHRPGDVKQYSVLETAPRQSEAAHGCIPAALVVAVFIRLWLFTVS